MHAKAIGGLKAGSGAPAYRPEREAQVLARLCEQNGGPLSDDAVIGVFRQVMSACLALEQKLRIAYLGPAGTFSHAAVARQFGSFVDAIACATIDEIFRAGESRPGRLRRRAGREFDRRRGRTHARPDVHDRAFDLRRDQAARAAEPAVQRAGARSRRQGLFARAVARAVRAVARAAPARRRARAGVEQRRGGAARRARSRARPRSPARSRHRSTALRCSRRTSRTSRTTRRASGCSAGRRSAASGRDETSLVMSAANRPGAMHALLEPLARHGVSMSRIESRPARTGLWEYLFFVDVVGHARIRRSNAALAELSGKAPFLKLLGSYPGRRLTHEPATIFARSQPNLAAAGARITSARSRRTSAASRSRRSRASSELDPVDDRQARVERESARRRARRCSPRSPRQPPSSRAIPTATVSR